MPTKAAGKPVPTMPPFDFEAYLREKDKRDFNLLIDQPEKCHIRGAEEGGGGSTESSTAPYMLIAVKSVAADFDKRQVTYAMSHVRLNQNYSVPRLQNQLWIITEMMLYFAHKKCI